MPTLGKRCDLKRWRGATVRVSARHHLDLARYGGCCCHVERRLFMRKNDRIGAIEPTEHQKSLVDEVLYPGGVSSRHTRRWSSCWLTFQSSLICASRI